MKPLIYLILIILIKSPLLAGDFSSLFDRLELEQINNYSLGTSYLNRIGLNREKPIAPLHFLKQRISKASQQCFPNNKKAQNWVERNLKLGHPGVWTTFFIQDFRNTTLSQKLKEKYESLDTNGKERLREYIKKLVKDEMTYKLMFESSFRPLLFNTDKTAPQNIEECKSSYTSQQQWDDVILDPKDKLPKIEVRHWNCDQPQVYYYSYYPKTSSSRKLEADDWSKTHYRVQDGSFAFYLGNKGTWSLAKYGNSILLKNTPPNGISGLYNSKFKKHLEESRKFKNRYYCKKQNSCKKGQIPASLDISKEEGLSCLRNFFTGSSEAIKVHKSPSIIQNNEGQSSSIL